MRVTGEQFGAVRRMQSQPSFQDERDTETKREYENKQVDQGERGVNNAEERLTPARLNAIVSNQPIVRLRLV